MIPTNKPKHPVISESKIVHRAATLHALARFVTEEAVALMFDIQVEDIYHIYCWKHIVYVHAKTVSRFVSYADFPPILGVESASKGDFERWKRRWYQSRKSKQAPALWKKFYSYQFGESCSIENLREWGKLLGSLKSYFSELTLEELREVYKYRRDLHKTKLQHQ